MKTKLAVSFLNGPPLRGFFTARHSKNPCEEERAEARGAENVFPLVWEMNESGSVSGSRLHMIMCK